LAEVAGKEIRKLKKMPSTFFIAQKKTNKTVFVPVV
jgi:hypothetical protein